MREPSHTPDLTEAIIRPPRQGQGVRPTRLIDLTELGDLMGCRRCDSVWRRVWEPGPDRRPYSMGLIKVHLSIEDYKEELRRQTKTILRLTEENGKLREWVRLVCKRFQLKTPSWW